MIILKHFFTNKIPYFTWDKKMQGGRKSFLYLCSYDDS